ncbi:MAG TPA: glycosyltransferase family 2 protein [Mesorhizobium sp.]|jgi:hypothetical protein|nr:glycosyltransferase family 2 protein [Mesorhizobium sp.]
MDYPVRQPGGWLSFRGPGVRERIVATARTLRFRRKARRLPTPSLEAVRAAPAGLAAGDVVLICVTRDAAKLLPSFLAHYRRIGVSRFAFVDDRSEDGTRSLLEAQPDVDLFVSDADFRQSAGGLVWRDMLVERYGRGRWYLSVDSDEYLVYPGYEELPLASFVADLERHRLRRAHAPMLDIYPDGPLGGSRPPAAVEAFPTETSPFFDGAGYGIDHEMYGTAVRGGPRRRLFGVEMRMSKFPLLCADRATRFAGGSHHGPLPLGRNFLPVHAVLLHHKFPAGAVEDFHEIARRGTHSGKSAFYKKIVAQDDFNEATDLRYPGSIRFEGSQQLVDLGFMRDLRQPR